MVEEPGMAAHYGPMPPHASHPPSADAPWRRWLGLSEVWAGGTLSARVLVWLRWLAAAGQGITLLVVSRMGVAIPWWQCGGAVAVTLITNALLEWWLRQIRWQMKEGFFHLMVWDALTLTFLLHWTGGLQNPFALFYLVQLTLAAVALRASAVFGLGLLTTLACGWLWQKAVPLQMTSGTAVSPAMLTQGFFVALVLAGGFVLVLLLALRRRSHRLQHERERLRKELDSRERFLSVAALATGFAHELGTPLGTIALAVEELRAEPDADTLAIIAREAARCQQVLQRLRELGQEATGLSAEPCAIDMVVETVLATLPESQRSRVKADIHTQGGLVACAGLREALLVLLRNALLSSADDLAVHLHVNEQPEWLRISVEDQGPGFSPEMLRHWGEPFRTTRDPGSGMGLGLFFVRRLAASMQGSVEVKNLPKGGARVSLLIPRHPHPSPAHESAPR